MDRVQTVVVGAGVVGLAVARELARAGREVVILEQAERFGSGVSARNSEVIHAGLYYPPGSLKARLCVEGRQRLYDYCAGRAIPHRRCGKLVVATDPGQRADLERIEATARAAGVDDLQWLSGEEARALEPALHCAHALLSPSTGIVDSHALMLSLLGEAEAAGASLALRSRVSAIETAGRAFLLTVEVEGAAFALECGELINSAGLGAPSLAAAIRGLPAQFAPQPHLAKGSYFSLAGRCPFSRLIYPVPDEAGLGVHLTLDLGGQAKFGPDVEWVDREAYDVDPRRAEGFYAAVRRYWPGLPPGALQPAYAGIRPKIVGPGEPAADFVIAGPQDHGTGGLVNLLGIESPGLTAALAIACVVRAQLDAERGANGV